jgi:hypothetical protein
LADAKRIVAAEESSKEPAAIIYNGSTIALNLFPTSGPSSLDRLGSPMTPEMRFIQHPQLTVAAALFLNGSVLGLKCSASMPAKSATPPATAPLSLYPTTLQQTVIHYCCADRFPMANMRDNMIIHSSVIDEDEFIFDLLTIPSFQIKRGKPSWDPDAWELVRNSLWEKKWGFLLGKFTDILKMAD